MVRVVPKLWALFKLHLAEVFAYKWTAFIWVLGDLQLTLIMPIVWRAVGGVAGYGPSEVVTYYVLSMTVSQFVTSHLLWDIGFDIREGVFSSLLLRPIPHLLASVSRNLAWRVGKLALFIPFLLLLMPLYGLPSMQGVRIDWSVIVAVLLGQTLAFLSAYCMAMVALWTTEFISLFEIYYMPELILSGRVVPLASLPSWAQSLAGMTHFRYTVSFPVELALGKLSGAEIQFGFVLQAVWTLVFYGLARLLFTKGVRQYSGFGA